MRHATLLILSDARCHGMYEWYSLYVESGEGNKLRGNSVRLSANLVAIFREGSFIVESPDPKTIGVAPT